MEFPTWISWLFLILGVLYLLADFNLFSFPISWYSALFLLVGLAAVAPGK